MYKASKKIHKQLGKGDYDVHCIDEGYERLGRLMTKVLERTIDESTGGN
ncbi:MAG TPA: hypothetical protein VFD35_04485 [Pricia sp.]|nr:hypothetical protein [Pricia sp.]